jgi:hypothetical protein
MICENLSLKKSNRYLDVHGRVLKIDWDIGKF